MNRPYQVPFQPLQKLQRDLRRFGVILTPLLREKIVLNLSVIFLHVFASANPFSAFGHLFPAFAMS